MSVEVVKVEQIIPVKEPKKTGKPTESRKEPKIYRGPSKRGPCKVCGKSGVKRYMVAVDFPEPTFLCDNCYKRIRSGT